ncbi:M23 family metallopeptidase [Streptomyces sp. NPDC050418]|uniref:M23 family metallopeptidase n=1 Tax=Streptomyces sp. NPDC050418 TaxID=3365612 RepID=UPI003791A733
MKRSIARPPRAGISRRKALGMTSAVVGAAMAAGAASSGTAWADPDPDPDCGIAFDSDFEEALRAGDELLPEQSDRAELTELSGAQAAGLYVPCARPLRRTYRVTSRYRTRGNWLAGYHTGIDLAVPQGTALYAVAAGVVVLASWSGSYGNAVTVRMPDGYYAVYGHLHRIRTRVGSRISAGARIGDTGSTGRATGPHLHLEVRAKRHYGSDVDPVAYLARGGVRLL